MVTSFDILVKLAGVPTAAPAPKSPMGINAPNAASVAKVTGQPTVKETSLPKQPGASKTPEIEPPKLGSLDARAALLGLGAGVGGFAAGKAFVEPAMQGAAKVSPWLIGALSALVVGSIAANTARQDERQKLKLQQALDNLTPAERAILLEQGGQHNIEHAGLHAGPGAIPSEAMGGGFY